jgi:hypothetical protein
MKPWFTTDEIDSSTHIILEYRHWEETHCYLLEGSERALLIDTGLGICSGTFHYGDWAIWLYGQAPVFQI